MTPAVPADVLAMDPEATQPGRMCPADYRHPPELLHRPPDFAAEVLYVVGGLYGNLAALEAVERLAAAERRPATVVFNGDFHWFDAEPEWFGAIERGVAPHRRMRGNVETEVARADDIGAGCGCAYPIDVHDDVVDYSNAIIAALRAAARQAWMADALGGLPTHHVAEVGGLRIGIVHGDAGSLAGWRFARDALDDPANLPWLRAVRTRSEVDVFASTHTCLAALRDFKLPGGRLTIINNGSAGMPNFAGTRFGLISRIATGPSPHEALYGVERDGIHIDAIPVPYDHDAFLDRFLACWPQGSPAHTSYHRRIVAGPGHSVSLATGGTVRLAQP
jgi:hypothetical protein